MIYDIRGFRHLSYAVSLQQSNKRGSYVKIWNYSFQINNLFKINFK